MDLSKLLLTLSSFTTVNLGWEHSSIVVIHMESVELRSNPGQGHRVHFCTNTLGKGMNPSFLTSGEG